MRKSPVLGGKGGQSSNAAAQQRKIIYKIPVG